MPISPEGFPPRLTRKIMPSTTGDTALPRRGSSLRGTGSAQPTLGGPRPPTRTPVRTTRPRRNTRQPTTYADPGDSEPDAYDNSGDDYDEDDDLQPVEYIDDEPGALPTRRPRQTPRRPRQNSTRAAPEPSTPEHEVELPQQPTESGVNSNEWLAAQGRSPLVLHNTTRRQRRVGTVPEMEQYRLVHPPSRYGPSGGLTFSTAMFGSGRQERGQFPYTGFGQARPPPNSNQPQGEPPQEGEDSGEGTSRRR